jgi:hypothetical protein
MKLFAAVELAELLKEQPEVATQYQGVFDQSTVDAVVQAFDGCYEHRHENGLSISIRLFEHLFAGRNVVYSGASTRLNSLRKDSAFDENLRRQAEVLLEELQWPRV